MTLALLAVAVDQRFEEIKAGCTDEPEALLFNAVNKTLRHPVAELKE